MHFGGRTTEAGGSPIDRVSRKYSLLINIDKTNVMVSESIACRILIQNEQLGADGYVPVLWIPELPVSSELIGLSF